MSTSANIIRQWFRWVTLSITVALLTACGGGDGDGDGDNNQAPVAIDGSLSTMVDTSANGRLSAVDPDDTALTFSIVLPASLGDVILIDDKTGEYSYTPDPDTTGSDEFKFQASDGNKSSAAATITVVITPNEPPVANNDNFTVAEGATISASVIDNPSGQDTDPENQPLSAELLTNPINGNLTIFNSDGSFTYTHNGGESTSDSFTYRIYDGKNYSADATVYLTIDPVNDAPIASDDSGATTNADVVLTIPVSSVLLNDTDPDTSDSLSVIATDPASAQGADVTVNAENIRYDPTGVTTFIALAAGQTLPGPDTFSYTVSDGNGGTDTATVSVTVTGVNDAPTATNDSGATNADVVLTIPASSVLLNDTDPDTNDSLNVTAADAVSAQGAVVTLNAGNISYDPSGVTAFIALATGDTLSDSFSYTVNDGNGGTDTATVGITVTGVNDPPVVVLATCSTMRREDTPLIDTLNANDPDNINLTYSLGSDGSGGAGPISTAKGIITITNQTTGEYTYTPDSGVWGTDSFTYRVEDSEGAFDIDTKTVIIDPRIMPLGDSITRGSFGSGGPSNELKIGYRKPLYDGLVAAGYSFDFVGTVTTDGTDPSYVPFDVDSEGHGGWSAFQIAYGNTSTTEEALKGDITNWLVATSPDIILLHIGTNGIDTIDPFVNAGDVGTILGRIDNWESTNSPITVILARIIDESLTNPNVVDFNIELDAMVADRIINGDDIIVVDMQNVLTEPADYADAVHPSNAGYEKMAPVWQTALTAQANDILYNHKCP